MAASSLQSVSRQDSSAWLYLWICGVAVPVVATVCFRADIGPVKEVFGLACSCLGVLALVEVLLLKSNPLLDAIWREAGGTNPIPEWSWSVYRATTTIGHPVSNGIVFSTASLLAIGQFGITRRRQWVACAVCCSAGAIASGARGSILAIATGLGFILAVMVLGGRRYAGIRRRLLGAVLIGVTVFLAVTAVVLAGRLASQEAAQSSMARESRAAVAITAVRGRPLLGAGPNTASVVVGAVLPGQGAFEDAWLELAVASGVVGAAVVMAAIGVAVGRAARLMRLGVAGALVAFTVDAATANILEGHPGTLVLLGLLLAAAADEVESRA